MVPEGDVKAGITAIVTNLNENGYTPDVTMEWVEHRNNWAAVQRILGTLREWDRVPTGHLINFINKMNDNDPNVTAFDS